MIPLLEGGYSDELRNVGSNSTRSSFSKYRTLAPRSCDSRKLLIILIADKLFQFTLLPLWLFTCRHYVPAPFKCKILQNSEPEDAMFEINSTANHRGRSRIWFCWMWLVAVVGRCLVGCKHTAHSTHIQQNQNNTPNAVTGPLFS